MKIITADGVAVGHGDRVFRHSSARDGLVLSVALAGVVAVGGATWLGALPGPIAVFAMVFLLLVGSVVFRMYRRGASSENWLMVTDGSRVLVKLRSHLNAEMPQDRSRVVELVASDLVGLRVTRSATSGHNAAGEPANTSSFFLDLLLRAESTELADAIRAERERQGFGTVWRHYPVTLPEATTVRLEWRGKFARIAPSIDEAVDVLRQFIPVLAPVAEEIDLGTSGHKPVGSDVERQIQLLVGEGKTLDAIVLAARAYGLSQGDAHRLVEQFGRPSARTSRLEGPAV